MDTQQRPAQYGHRRDHTCHETETSCVVLQIDPIKKGRINTAKMERYMRKIVIGCLTGFLAVSMAPNAHAGPTEDAVKRIIEELIKNPPASDSDLEVGEMLC